jgi:L-2-hydroxyglutarate oxidase LhgO
MRVAIVGGGILGLAAGRLLARERPDVDVVLLEKESSLAQHQTGRNSGVVHAGLYYEPGSLKARLCRRGGELLRAFCLEHDLAYSECGKVLVATREDELPRLDGILERAHANGVTEARLIGAPELHALEPYTVGIAALHSPTTAIVDYGEICAALAAEMRRHGAVIRTSTSVDRVVSGGDGARIELRDGSELLADRVLVCAGLHADRLARASGEPAEPRIVPFRGEYWRLRPDRSHLVKGLVYPAPDPSLPFLGVHLTRTVDGSVLVGPNAVLAYAREGYRRRDVDAADLWDTVSWPGMWRVARRHWASGAHEVARSLSKRAFVREARRYVPELQADDVVSARAGVRAQAVDRDGSLVDDFRLDVSRNAVWVRNAPSPAATSSLAIAEELVSHLGL